MLGGLLGIVIANGFFPLLNRDRFLIAGCVLSSRPWCFMS
jgi:hypothetical protein